MLYPDFKLRYSCLGQDAIKSSSDNKTAVWALMDGIPFDRERYRLGHTMVFFRAGALGGMEEERDKLVIKWVRMIQGEVLKRVRGAVYKKKFYQREFIKVGQRNFRKYLENRDWGWFVIIQKTRGLIGLPNPEEELRILEEKANEKYGAYKSALDVTAQLEGSMDGLKTDIDAMTIKLSEEQGNISVYTERQTKAVAAMAATKAELAEQQIVLAQEESSKSWIRSLRRTGFRFSLWIRQHRWSCPRCCSRCSWRIRCCWTLLCQLCWCCPLCLRSQLTPLVFVENFDQT